jgi:hypothetical protein
MNAQVVSGKPLAIQSWALSVDFCFELELSVVVVNQIPLTFSTLSS